jgi:2-methylcitrate dehydratase
MQGEMGYASALSAPRWGFQDVFLSGKPIRINRELGCYVMENILFKVAFPAEFHAQTAAEAAIALAPQVTNRLDDIAQIKIFTQESAVRIIDKKGPLNNPADRDHCLQYIVAVALLHGSLDSEHYEDKAASDPRIDQLRDKMIVAEDPRYTREYLDPQLRSIGNRIQIIFKDGTSTSPVEVEFPIGHRRRRDQAKPLLIKKFKENALCRFNAEKTEKILSLWNDASDFAKTRVSTWMDLLATDQ